MNTDFPNKLSELRRSKNVSQKEAATALGISQALLSHYEKGIRECGLDFVRRVAVYYGVTTDWLLGLSDTRLGAHEIFDIADAPSDRQLRAKTLLRCLIRLSEEMLTRGEASESSFNDYFALAIYRFLAALRGTDNTAGEWMTMVPAAADKLSAMLMAEVANGFPQQREAATEDVRLTLCYRTLIAHCEALIRDETAEMLSLA